MSATTHASDARFLLRRAIKAGLATLDKATGTPYASLVGVASLADATPIILISRLARHTQNAEADGRASLLVETVNAAGDGLAEGRATIMGRLVKAAGEEPRRRYLARHPAAAGYAGFADFAFYALEVSEVHIVQGFGRIATMPGSDFLLGDVANGPLAALEQDAIAHMNEDHAEAVNLYAVKLCGGPAGAWRAIGIDAEGIDLASDEAVARLAFPQPVKDGTSLRAMLARLAGAARAV